MGYVVITWWPEEETAAIMGVLKRHGGLTTAAARAQVQQVADGGLIYLHFPTLAQAEAVANAAAVLGALAECGEASTGR